MRVIDCTCGGIVQAANDEELAQRLVEHARREHPDDAPDEERARDLVAERAYTAMDA